MTELDMTDAQLVEPPTPAKIEFNIFLSASIRLLRRLKLNVQLPELAKRKPGADWEPPAPGRY